MQIISVNTDAIKKFEEVLKKLHRSALPTAIRGTLNKAAFDVKQNTLLPSAQASFINRSNNFFKANSRVQAAVGFDVNTMKSTVGMIDTGLKGASNYAVKDLQQQEDGGTITNKSFIPMKPARSGGSANRLVKPNARLSEIKNIVDARKMKGTIHKSKFVRAVNKAGVGGYVLSEINGKLILWKVNSLNKTKSGKFKLTPLYDYEQNRTAQVHATHFMSKASLLSAMKMDDFYKQEAERQLTIIRGEYKSATGRFKV